MSIRPLPPRPSLASVKKQAKQLLRLHRTDPDGVRARIQEHHPRPGAFRALSDAQLVVAREYGFASWRRLSEHIDELTVVAAQGEAARFLDLACLTYGNDSTARIDRAMRMLADRPALAAIDAHTAAATANMEALRRILGGDARRASASGGPRRWPPLLYLCYSRVTEQLPEAERHRRRPAADRARCRPQRPLHVGANVPVHGPHRRDGRRPRAASPASRRIRMPRELAELLLDAGADPNDAPGALQHDVPARQPLAAPAPGPRAYRPGTGSTGRPATGSEPSTFLLGHAATKGFADRVELLLRHGADPRGRQLLQRPDPITRTRCCTASGDVAALLRRAGATPTELSPEDRVRAACMSGDEAAARAALDAAPQSLSGPEPMHTARLAGQRGRGAVPAEPGRGSKRHREGRHDRAAPRRVEQSAGRGQGPGRARGRVRCATPATGRRRQGGPTTPATPAMRDYLLDHCTDGLDLVSFGRAAALRRYLSEHPGFATSIPPGGGSPLHHLRDDIDDLEPVMDALLKAGADLGARDSRKETAHQSAVRRGELVVAALLSR